MQRETAAIQYEKLVNQFAEAQSVAKINASDVLGIPRWLLDIDNSRVQSRSGNRFDCFASTGV